MKHLLFVTFFFAGSLLGYSQAFKKNNVILSGGFGLGAGYGYRSFSSSDYYYSYYSSEDYMFSLNFSVGVILPVAAEYALSNRFGIGLSYQQGSYVNTSLDHSKANVFGAFGAFHFGRRERLDLYTRLNIGYGILNDVEDLNSSSYNASSSRIPTSNNSFRYVLTGGFVKPSFGLRTYFSEHVGMFADIGVGVYSYHTTQVETDSGTYNVPYNPLRIVMINAELTTGIAFKF